MAIPDISLWQRLNGQLTAWERTAGMGLAQRIPAYAIVRIFLGIIYFWFGFLKFHQVPGQSPAEDLIRAVWGPYLNAEAFIRALAYFETGVGFLLIANIRPRLLALVLFGHVLGTFATVAIAPAVAIDLKVGFYALTLTGQYILKNLLILSSCLFLLHGGSRRASRKTLRVPGKISLAGHDLPAVVVDISEGGLCLIVPDLDQELAQGLDFVLRITTPLGNVPLEIRCVSSWSVAKRSGKRIFLMVGCRFAEPDSMPPALRACFLDDPLEAVALVNREARKKSAA